MEYFEAIAAERTALAGTLEGLSEQQWQTPSLCPAWTVRQVAAHLITPLRHGLGTFLFALIAAGGNPHRASERQTAKEAARPAEAIVTDLRGYAGSRFTPPTLGPGAPLAEVLLHGQDIRVPLGISGDRPADPWRGALDFLVTPKARRGFVPRALPPLRYVASDLDWSHGEGEEAAGPAAALAMAMAGRTARLADLTGPGAAVLRTWSAG